MQNSLLNWYFSILKLCFLHCVLFLLSCSTWRATNTWRWTSVCPLCWRRTPWGWCWTPLEMKVPGSTSSPSTSYAPSGTAWVIIFKEGKIIWSHPSLDRTCANARLDLTWSLISCWHQLLSPAAWSCGLLTKDIINRGRDPAALLSSSKPFERWHQACAAGREWAPWRAHCEEVIVFWVNCVINVSKFQNN